MQQSLRISIPENIKYLYVPPCAPLTAKHAPLPELLDEEENTSYVESKDNNNSLYNSQKKFQSESHNQTNTYCMPNDKFMLNDDQNQGRSNNYPHQFSHSGENPLTKAYTFDSEAFNRARNRKFNKANRMGVRFNDEEDGNGGEEQMLTGSYSYERTTEKEDFVFETPKRHSMLFPMGNEQPRPDVTSSDVINHYDNKELASKDRLSKRT